MGKIFAHLLSNFVVSMIAKQNKTVGLWKKEQE